MSITLASLATQFLERPGLSPHTIDSYESTLMPLLKLYGRWSIEIIDRDVLVEYLSNLDGIKFTTHRRHQAVITALFNFAVEQRLLKSNPASQLKRRKPNPKLGEHNSEEEVRYLTPQQLELLYQAVKKDARMDALVHLLHSSGARIAEILSLNLKDLDVDRRRFQVIGKGNKQRWCFYNDSTRECLFNYVKYYRYNNSPALFTAQKPQNNSCSRLSYARVYQSWIQITSHIPELKGTRLHDLRHTWATERMGILQIEELRALMGHEKIQTTLRYSKVTSQRAEEVAQLAFEKIKNYGE
ncbi:tyrosine-type recombinase/integrase [Scytonema sp. NUACC21]